MGYDQKCWGPPAWRIIHGVSFRADAILRSGEVPMNVKRRVRMSVMKILRSIPDFLPCKYCREHCKQNFADMGFATSPLLTLNNPNFLRFTSKLHNMVNKKLGKPLLNHRHIKNKSFPIPSEDVGVLVYCIICNLSRGTPPDVRMSSTRRFLRGLAEMTAHSCLFEIESLIDKKKLYRAKNLCSKCFKMTLTKCITVESWKR